jgi:type VI secretion system protein ImpK
MSNTSGAYLRSGRESQQGMAPPGPPSVTLRELFSDLITYVLLFRAVCLDRPPTLSAVREQIDGFIAEQDRRVRAGHVSHDSYRLGLFAVLAWVDEIILNSPWPQRGEWRHLMLTTFGTLNAGKEFFARLESLPPTARDVKEIYFLCLALGFEGKYALGDNREHLRDYRRRLYRDIAAAGDVQRERLFPEAYGAPRKPALIDRRRIGAAWFALTLAVPCVLFGIYWYLLHQQTASVLARLATPIAVGPTATRARSLVEELRGRGIQAEQASRGVVITLPNVLFELSSSSISGDGQQKIKEVAAALERHAAGLPVLVEGHASRERGGPDDQNQRLSDDRATNVVALLKASGLRNERVTGKGFGSKAPVATNETEQGRRQNRRVEIIVENIK